MTPVKLLEAIDIHRDFKRSRGFLRTPEIHKALDGVSISLDVGETVGIIGESGCGKSTLSKILIGLLEPTSGHVKLLGRDFTSIGRLERSRIVQPVFQDPYSSLNPRACIEDIVMLPLVAQGIERTARIKIVRDMLDRVGLPGRVADAYPRQLSGGQRQRVAIARALVLKPQIVICDEPTSALDISVQAQILNLLSDLQAEFRLSYIFISHDLAVIESVSDRIFVMYQGRVVEAGPSDAVMGAPQSAYTRKLLSSYLDPALV